MDTDKTFKLTVRREDLLGAYEKQIHFKLFSREHAGRLMVIGVCLLLGGISLGASISNDKYVFYFILFTAGICYCTHDLWSIYRTKKRASADVEEWIKQVQQFKTHILSVEEHGIVYRRDEETRIYPYTHMVTSEEEKHLGVRLLDSTDSLIIPKQSFTDGEYDLFAEAVNNKINEKNAGRK